MILNKPIVWTIAGSDSGGGAGIQADLHAFQALGTFGCCVITTVTAQNSLEVTDLYDLPAAKIVSQIQALHADLPARAIKLGLLGSEAAAAAIASYLKHATCFVVLDPVLVATSGDKLFSTSAQNYLQQLHSLFSLATIITPNLREAELLAAMPITSYADMQSAASKLLAKGARSVLIKGGHFDQDNFSQDYWTDGKSAGWLSAKRQGKQSYHGTGCTLAAAIAAALALGYAMTDALVIAKMYVTQGIRHAVKYGKGAPPIAQLRWPHSPYDLPQLTSKPIGATHLPFPPCGPAPLGLYPIVDRASWLQKLLPLGVTTIQLRIKDLHGSELEHEIKHAILLARHYQARLFINDYWELAIAHGAYGVHLGQDDLKTADMKKIYAAGLRLGISSHSYAELAIAHALKPSYVAFGPIFATQSKTMAAPPQGLKKLRRIRQLLDYPLVAIGGIDALNSAAVLATGVNGIALITAITLASDPIAATRELLRRISYD